MKGEANRSRASVTGFLSTPLTLNFQSTAAACWLLGAGRVRLMPVEWEGPAQPSCLRSRRGSSDGGRWACGLPQRLVPRHIVQASSHSLRCVCGGRLVLSGQRSSVALRSFLPCVLRPLLPLTAPACVGGRALSTDCVGIHMMSHPRPDFSESSKGVGCLGVRARETMVKGQAI